MDFHLTKEQLMIQQVVRGFAMNEIKPKLQDLLEKEDFPYDIYQMLGELGMLGIPYDEKYGGAGADLLTFTIVLEELARVDNSVANSVMANSSCATLLHSFGTEEQKLQWLPQILSGIKVGSIGLTEPNAGSDAASIQTRAELSGDEWILNGSKMFISNSGTKITGPIIIAAVTGKNPDGRNEISNIIVPSGTDGLKKGKKLKKVGWKASDTWELFFDDCRVPAENLLGERGAGLRQTLGTINQGRVLIAALALGLAQGCLDYSLQYVNERNAFGHKLVDFQAIQHKLADMAMNVELARLIVYKAATKRDEGVPFSMEASMAKLFASEAAMRAAHDAVHIHGGYGVITEYPIAHFFGDAKILEIVEGTSEIQRSLIARFLQKEYKAR